ncbi:hypothetical protein OIO90_005416 [Microbotryomycetes sp. JL221]|nr:hypothetical protein OIO90_005416 [Microbotryomycetes sp. JL221]
MHTTQGARLALAISALVSSVVIARPMTTLQQLQQQQQQQLTFNVPQQDDTLITFNVDSLFESSSFNQLSPRDQVQLRQYVAQSPEPRLVQLDSFDAAPISITEGHKALLTLQGINFIDVTDDPTNSFASVYSNNKSKGPTYPKKLKLKLRHLQHVYNSIDQQRMMTFITKFTSFRTRHYKSDTGKQSQQFLLQTIKDIVNKGNNIDDMTKSSNVTVREFSHPWGQNSIIVRFEPDSSTVIDERIVILGAHQDSTNLLPWFAAPGADDDGSGTTTLVTTLRALIEFGFKPSDHAVEIHFYSAEEGGLLGSQAVAQSYAQQGKQVLGMLQQDMTSYVKPGTQPVIGIIRDFVNPELTDYISLVVDEFCSIGRVETQCGYACSDHASWSKIGAPSAFAIESKFEDSNKQIHSSGDTIQNVGFSIDHVEQFVRLSIALAVNLGGAKSFVKL